MRWKTHDQNKDGIPNSSKPYFSKPETRKPSKIWRLGDRSSQMVPSGSIFNFFSPSFRGRKGEVVRLSGSSPTATAHSWLLGATETPCGHVLMVGAKVKTLWYQYVSYSVYPGLGIMGRFWKTFSHFWVMSWIPIALLALSSQTPPSSNCRNIIPKYPKQISIEILLTISHLPELPKHLKRNL